jgi:hypothetical protein
MSDDHQESLDLFDDHEEVVSEDGKKVTRKGIYLLPNLLTTASLFSGFFSIVSAINGNFIASGMALFAAQMLDGLDGRVARLTNSQPGPQGSVCIVTCHPQGETSLAFSCRCVDACRLLCDHVVLLVINKRNQK